VRRILLLLAADGVLESKTDEEGTPIRINSGHPKGQAVLGDQAPKKPAQLKQSLPNIVDLGPEFSISMSRKEVKEVNSIKIVQLEKRFIVRVYYTSGFNTYNHDSRPCTTWEEAERVRLLVHSRLNGTSQ
jgi:hypothetical protein